MTDRIKLVRKDTRPQIVCNLKTSAGVAIDCTNATVKMYFRKEGTTTILTTITGTLLPNFIDSTGATITSGYTVAGSGGRVSFSWPANSLNVDAGNYEGEVEITFSDTTIQTVYDVLKFKVRADF